MQLTHSSGGVEVSEMPDSSKLQVISTTKTLIHDCGPKQNSNGSPWVGSVESPVATSAPQHELANMINQFGDGIELDFSTS